MKTTQNMKNRQDKFRKLTIDEVQRSIKASNMVSHLWLYSKSDTYQRTHNNSIFLTRTMGEPIACIVVQYDSCMCDDDFKYHFGKDVFIDGGVSPDDKDGVVFQYDCYYYKGA
jgi:hypothetical protein